MVDVWYSSFVNQKAAHQIVHFYVANDVMQTGMRKYGRDIPDAFSEKLLLAIAVTMSEGTQKTQDIVRKLVQVWRERHVLSDHVIDTMSDMCSTVVKARKEALKDTMTLAKQHAATSKADDESLVLQDIPDAVDSELTRKTVQMIEELEGAVVSTDLLSDRMFQLSSNLHNFLRATNVSDEDDSPTTNWDQLELPVFEIDLESSATQVAAFRQHLEAQLDKRMALTAHFKSLTNHVVLEETALKEIAVRADDETSEMQALFELCVEAAEAKERKRREHEAAAALQRRHSHTDVPSTSVPHDHYLEHRRSDSALHSPFHHQNHRPQHQGTYQDDQYARKPSSYLDRDANNGGGMDWRASSHRSGRSRSRSRSRSRHRNTSRHQDERRRSAERTSYRSDSRDRQRPSRFHDHPRPDLDYDQGYPPQRGGWIDGGDSAKRPRQFY
ncbi:hypothetical protein DYB32_008637 [Aphanomyces invadans]|uniref:CID domain-containing protein n=1 Tax=Aphanomyces invadans TaxID=157072 RepID=A0A3R7CV56_9STRA|nr:hypothetical protein DYB32_008637 [Aphanomyces invadans]